MQRKITIVRPETQTVSVNDSCSLNCRHCQGYFLNGMDCKVDYSKDSFLISGGCDSEGRVIISESFLRMLKDKGKRINIHSGLVDEEMAIMLGKYADCVSFDFVTDNKTIKNIYHLDKTEEDFIDSYQLLKKHCSRVVPHILIGLGNEKRSLDILENFDEKEICFIVLMKHPQIENDLQEPSIDYIEDILKYARLKFDVIHLGCMRPLNRKQEIDSVAIKYVDSIVNPWQGLDLSGFEIEEKGECCCL